MNKKRVLITGITGQDARYLTEIYLNQGYEVHGIIRRHSVAQYQTYRIDEFMDKITLHYGDLTDFASIFYIIQKVNPDIVINLGAQSHVRVSFDNPLYTAQATGIGALNVFESVRLFNPKIRIYQGSSSEMFGNCIDEDGFQRESTPMKPVSPYGASKLFAHNLANNYRNSYGMFISSSILFNHESPYRGITFVTNKVCKGVVDIFKGEKNELILGNLDASRDWGHAKDYMMAVYMIMNLEKPDDFVCSTGISKTVRELCDYCFSKFNLNYLDYVKVDEKFLRPEELNILKGDSSKLREKTGWKPTYTFETMLDEMLEFWLNSKN